MRAEKSQGMGRRSGWRWSMAMTAALEAGVAPVRASSQETTTPAPPDAETRAVPDSVFSALRGQHVILTTRAGARLRVLVVSSDGELLFVASVPEGVPAVVPKRDVIGIQVVASRARVAASASLEPEAPPAPLPRNTRHLGLSLGLVPSAMVDLEYRHAYGFANVSLLLPFVSAIAPESGFPYGGNPSTPLWAFAIGAGWTGRLFPTTRWQYDLVAVGGGSNWNPSATLAVPYGVVGAGLGFHATLDGGFTVGIKGPLLGYGTGTSGGPGAGIGRFLTHAAVGVPLLSFGYRF